MHQNSWNAHLVPSIQRQLITQVRRSSLREGLIQGVVCEAHDQDWWVAEISGVVQQSLPQSATIHSCSCVWCWIPSYTYMTRVLPALSCTKSKIYCRACTILSPTNVLRKFCCHSCLVLGLHPLLAVPVVLPAKLGRNILWHRSHACWKFWVS